MQYLLIDKNSSMVEAWEYYFKDEPNVVVKEGNLTQVLCDAIVSPANSFGFMDGGVDYAISMRLRWDFQLKLQQKIKNLPEGELLVGRAMVLPTGDEVIKYLVSAPTMRVPMTFNISTSVNAYLAMKAALLEAKKYTEIQSMAIPGFCTGVGRMKPMNAAKQMSEAFKEIEKGEKIDFADFGEAQKHQIGLNSEGMIFE